MKSKPRELKRDRRVRQHGCWGHLIIAPLWVAFEANLGTLLRTCDAVGACMAVPGTKHYDEALARGDTLKRRPHIHRVRSKLDWIEAEREASEIVGVELTDNSMSLSLVAPAARRTVVLLGHEHDGIPEEALEMCDRTLQIPMVGQGASLNVAVAGSLALYKLAGLI